MKLTKQDLMRLPKERLAELIVEMQEEKNLTLTTPEKSNLPFIPLQTQHSYCWESDDVCTNPQMDCINCPRHSSSIQYVHTGPHIDTYISGKGANTSATDGKEHPNSTI